MSSSSSSEDEEKKDQKEVFEEDSSGSSSSSEDSSSDEGAPPKKKKKAQKQAPTPKDVPQSPKRSKDPANKSVDPLALELPTFSLQDDISNKKRYELWTLRLPANLPLTALENCELAIPSSAMSVPGGTLSSSTDDDNKPATFQTDKGDSFILRWGSKVENESFRLLVRSQKENDMDDSDESDDEKNNKSLLTPTNVPFRRHINVVSYMQDLVATKVAPGADRAPKPDAKSAVKTSGPFTKLRKAYQDRPQKKGMKRRWMPLGSNQQPERPRSLSGSSLLSLRQSRKASSAQVGTRNEDNDSSNDDSSSDEAPKVKVKKEDDDKHRRKRSSPKKEETLLKRKRSSSGNDTPIKRERSSSEMSGTSHQKSVIKKETAPVKRKRSGSEMSGNNGDTPDQKPPKNGEKLSKAGKKARKAEKKEAKRAKKEARKAKKEMKKEKS